MPHKVQFSTTLLQSPLKGNWLTSRAPIWRLANLLETAGCWSAIRLLTIWPVLLDIEPH